MTLVEILVVLGIVILLAVISIPAMRPMLESHQVAEAARNAQVYLNRARIRATETQRPCGVRFEVYTKHPDYGSGGNNVALVLRQLESPPPYGGLSTDVKIKLSGSPYKISFTVSNELERTAFARLVQEGDQIQFNYQGPRYRIGSIVLDSDDEADTMTLSPAPPSGIMTVLDSRGLPFTVFRSPRPSAATPAALPRGAVIDLKYSGRGSRVQFNAATEYVDVVFSPSGAIDSVSCDGSPVSSLDPIFLLVGRWERTFAAAPEDDRRNWEDSGNFWLTISPGTGMVSVNQVLTDVNDPSPTVTESRIYARQVQDNKGGP